MRFITSSHVRVHVDAACRDFSRAVPTIFSKGEGVNTLPKAVRAAWCGIPGCWHNVSETGFSRSRSRSNPKSILKPEIKSAPGRYGPEYGRDGQARRARGTKIAL